MASSIAAAVQRKDIDAERQRFTLRFTRRTVPIMFSMMLVHAKDLLSSLGNPSRITVRISSNPSSRLRETPGYFHASREVAAQLFGFIGVVHLPSLAKHTADRGMQRWVQPLDDVASLVKLMPTSA